MMADGAWNFRPERRTALADRVLGALRADPRVADAALFGSLTSPEADGYPADRYSDIDIAVRVRGVSARAFFVGLPALIQPVGAVLLWDATIVSDRSIAHVWFAGYPLFWSVDIACLSAEPTDPGDLLDGGPWPHGFGLWVLTLKRLMRAMDALALLGAAVGSPPDNRGFSRGAADALLALLETWRARAAARDLAAEQPYALGVEVVRRLLP